MCVYIYISVCAVFRIIPGEFEEPWHTALGRASLQKRGTGVDFMTGKK
jgi:hypothetical protein